jgi:hypothetical protein
MYSGRLIKPTILPLLGYILLFSAIGAVFSMLLLTGALWNTHQFAIDNAAWLAQVQADPSFVLTDEQAQMYRLYSLTIFMNQVIRWMFTFFVPILTLMVSAGKIYSLLSHDPDTPQTWKASFKQPFNSLTRFATALLLILLLLLGITFGLIIFILPGILVMVFFFFSIHSLVIDEKEKMQVFRGGTFYARDNFLKILGLLLLGFFLPTGLCQLYAFKLLDLLIPESLWLVWLDPATRNLGGILLYFFCSYFFQNVLFFWFPVIYTVGFYEIQSRKIEEINAREQQATNQQGDGIKTIYVGLHQKSYNCLKCGARMPLGAKKCSSCGELFKVVIKRTK